MNSCLYRCRVMHLRLKPKVHRMNAGLFMFYLDLDELDALSAQSRWLGRNQRRVYNFRDEDHAEYQDRRSTAKENVRHYVQSKGVDLGPDGRIMLLTNLRTWGYIFNPVSFYFCFDAQGRPKGVLVEIGNTFREFKPFFLGEDVLVKGRYQDQRVKHFYISPFSALDKTLEFNLAVPGDRLDIQIDVLDDGEKFFFASLTGQRVPLTSRELWKCTWIYPLVTLKVMALIHWHAFLVYLKQVPFHSKEENPHLQKEVFRVWRKNSGKKCCPFTGARE